MPGSLRVRLPPDSCRELPCILDTVTLGAEPQWDLWPLGWRLGKHPSCPLRHATSTAKRSYATTAPRDVVRASQPTASRQELLAANYCRFLDWLIGIRRIIGIVGETARP